jgi:hypothetical protein
MDCENVNSTAMTEDNILSWVSMIVEFVTAGNVLSSGFKEDRADKFTRSQRRSHFLHGTYLF